VTKMNYSKHQWGKKGLHSKHDHLMTMGTDCLTKCTGTLYKHVTVVLLFCQHTVVGSDGSTILKCILKINRMGGCGLGASGSR
jgi:hypothetical protein